MKRANLIKLFLVVVIFVTPVCSHAISGSVKLLRKKDSSKRIQDLVFKRNEFPVHVKGSGVNTQITVTIVGLHKNVHTGLIYKGYKIKKRADGAFKLTVPVWGPYSPFVISTVTPEGGIIHEKFVLSFEKWKDFKADYVKKKFNFNAGLGITSLSFSQTDKPDFSSIMATAKVSGFYLLAPGVLDVGLNAFMNVMPITTNREGYSLRFLGINGRFGYVLPFIERPWRVTLMIGYYYITTMVSIPSGLDITENGFGFTNMNGPQIFPLILHYLDSGDVLMAYFKFSPVKNGSSLFSLSNREISGGLGWIMPNKSEGAWSFHLDIAKLELEFPQTAESNFSQISAFSISLSAAYGF